jgi:hypothetical protein
MIGRSITLVMLIFITSMLTIARAQSPFPDPQTSPQANTSEVACANEFQSLRDEAERRGQLVKAASARHVSAAETCKLLGYLGGAEVRMIKYLEANVAARCKISSDTISQFMTAHKSTERMVAKVCAAASVRGLPLDCCVASDFGDPVLFPSGRR